MSKIRSAVRFGALACAAIRGPAASQPAAYVSVPDPTRLQAVAAADGAELVWAEPLGAITSADANATISLIEVAISDGERVRGVLITLESTTSSDRIYVTASLLPLLRDEL